MAVEWRLFCQLMILRSKNVASGSTFKSVGMNVRKVIWERKCLIIYLSTKGKWMVLKWRLFSQCKHKPGNISFMGFKYFGVSFSQHWMDEKSNSAKRLLKLHSICSTTEHETLWFHFTCKMANTVCTWITHLNEGGCMGVMRLHCSMIRASNRTKVWGDCMIESSMRG